MTGVKGYKEEAGNAMGLRGEMLEQEPMARHTSWRTGGVAERFYRPADVDDLARFLAGRDDAEPVLIVGLGSNLLVRDGGIRGTVICTAGMLTGLELREDGSVRAEAGVTCAKLARFCAREDLCGCEFLAGIPGTVGGALAMNAGANGGEMWDFVTAVETLDRQGRRHLRQRDEYHIGYRHVRAPAQEWFVAAHLRLGRGDGAAAQALIREMLAHRTATQPTGQSSCGSVFRNPAGDHAGRLVESCGLKGYCVGGACVSDKHANFIINTGNATAADIESLIAHVQQVVLRDCGVALQPEVRIVGEAATGRPEDRT